MEKVVNKNHLTSFYQSKKVFVTGHTGFKGSWLVAWLYQLGAIIKGYALEPEHDNCLYNLLPENYCESVIADIRNKEKLTAEILSFQPDYIFHLAAQPLVRRSYEIPAETFEVNAIGTANLLEAVKNLDKSCSIIIITTDKVYENKETDILYKENDRLGGYDPYSASKACTELVINSFRNSFFNKVDYQTHKKIIVSARAGNVIGGGDYSDDRIIPDIVKGLQKKEYINVRNPNSVRPWQHVLEPLSGYLLLGALLHENAEKLSDAYNFGPEPNDHLTVGELVNIALKVWGVGNWENKLSGNQPHEAGLLKLDISLAKKELNWFPKLPSATAVKWTMDWYKNEKNIQLDFTLQQINDFMNL